MKNSWTEISLINACLKNDRWAQEVFYKKYYGLLMSICLRYTSNREEAAFILNQSFHKIFKELRRFSKTKGSIKTWMYRITINTAIDHYRKEIRNEKNNVTLQQLDFDSHTNDDPISSLAADEIIALIQKLSPMYKMVFNLFVVEGYNHKEIAKMLSISVGTSKSNLSKAKRRMRELWLSHNKNASYGYQ